MLKSKLNWRVGHSENKNETPARFVPATVPGAVQLDWAKAEAWPEYWKAEEFKNYRWMEDKFWVYESILNLDDYQDFEQLYFYCGGIDYEWEIYLNDVLILDYEGMFKETYIDLKKHSAKTGDSLKVCIFPAPKKSEEDHRSQADQTCKPPCSYGWDWHPRLIPLGIWQDCYLLGSKGNFILDSNHTYTLNENLTEIELNLNLELENNSETNITIELLSPEGECVYTQNNNHQKQKIQSKVSLNNIKLWWPHDHGEPALYTLIYQIKNSEGELLDEKSQKIGFRKIKLVMHETQWKGPAGYPKSRNLPPITLEINNRKIFGKGSNWVPPEIFPGIITKKTVEPLLKLAKESNFNILRCWGGGPINKECFYELCDELGLLVWTEFPLACMSYEDDDHYLGVLESESTSIISRVKQHPSQTIWCGGNELFNAWSGMTDQSKALRLLNAQCYKHDPNVPFLATSPLAGMGHGGYLFRGLEDEEIFESYAGTTFTALTEYGVPSPSSIELIKEVIPEGELWPPKAGGAWEAHHAYNAWVELETWLTETTLEHYFGKTNTLEELVERGQLLQSEGLKFIYEEARRQKPNCSMALNWCYNEVWPAVANLSIINWPCRPKPALAEIKQACRAVLYSARSPKFKWSNNDVFEAELYLLNDRYEKIAPSTLKATLKIADELFELLSWQHGESEENTNIMGPKIKFVLPKIDNATNMTLSLENSDFPERNHQYQFVYNADYIDPRNKVNSKQTMNM